MKKKMLSLFLATIMSCSICACGGSETTQTEKENDIEAKIEFVENDESWGSYYRVYLSEEDIKECSTIIDLTMDNWSNYFEDYEYTKHIVEENEFGDKTENDVTVSGFGAKEGLVIGILEPVVFKIEADDTDGYDIARYRTEGVVGFSHVKHGILMIEDSSGQLERYSLMRDCVPIEVQGKIVVLENLPLDISKIDYFKTTNQTYTIELIVGDNVVQGDDLSHAFSEYYKYYMLE